MIMGKNLQIAQDAIIADSVKLGDNVNIGYHCIIEDNVILGDNVTVDSGTVIRKNTSVGNGGYIGANCIIGEHLMDYFKGADNQYSLNIGENALIRSNSIIYGASDIGNHFQTGHHVTIREKTVIGHHVSCGTFCDIQGSCEIGNYVRLHSNVFISQFSAIEDCVWIFPHVILTNDPTPPSNDMLGIKIKSYAIIAAGAILLPGIIVEEDSLVAAGAVVTKDVQQFSVVAGNPAKRIADIREVKNKVTGENAYPWRQYFDRAMPWEGIGFDEWYDSLKLE